MAKLITRKHPTKPYVVREYNPQHQKSFANLEDAQAYLASVEGTEIAAEGDETFRSYATRWMEQTKQNKALGTNRNYEYHFRLHIFPVFGDRLLSQITREQCKNFLLGSGFTASKAQHLYMTLSTVLNEAVRDKKIPENPAKDIRIRNDHKRAELLDPPLTYANLESLENGLNPEWRLALWLMYGAGLRLGESLAVRIGNIREGGTILRVEEQVISGRRRIDPTIAPMKARKAGDYRDIPLAGWLKDRIDKHIAEFGITGYLFPEFVNGEFTPGAFQGKFNRTRKKAGVPKLHPHMLRHYFVSTMLTDGCSMEDVARWLGHRSIQLTYDTYSHMMPASTVRAREASDKAMEQFKKVNGELHDRSPMDGKRPKVDESSA